MNFSIIKSILLIVVFATSQLITYAQPGILKVVLKSYNGNVQEIITLDNQVGEVVSISILNSKNQIVYQAKHSIHESAKVLCELPKDFYRVSITNVNNQARKMKYTINLE